MRTALCSQNSLINRENTGNIFDFGLTLSATTAENTVCIGAFPPNSLKTEQGINSKEQGTSRRDQGIQSDYQGIAGNWLEEGGRPLICREGAEYRIRAASPPPSRAFFVA
jgi:hypothetical protein